MKKITKKQLDELYKKPRDTKNPFERLEMLMSFALQELERIKITQELGLK